MVVDECPLILTCLPILCGSMSMFKTIWNKILRTMLRLRMSLISCLLAVINGLRTRTESDLDSIQILRVCKRSKRSRNPIQMRIWPSGKGIHSRWISSRILSNNLVLVQAWGWPLHKSSQLFVLASLVTFTHNLKQTPFRLIVTIITLFCKIRYLTHLITICNNKHKCWLLE